MHLNIFINLVKSQSSAVYINILNIVYSQKVIKLEKNKNRVQKNLKSNIFFFRLFIKFCVFLYFKFHSRPRTNFKNLNKKLLGSLGIYIWGFFQTSVPYTSSHKRFIDFIYIMYLNFALKFLGIYC